MYPGWLEESEGRLLENLAAKSERNMAVEIGSLYGKSTLHILKGMKARFGTDFTVICIDPWLYIDKEREYPGVIFFKEMYKAGYDRNVILIKSLSNEAFPIVMTYEYGFAFVDGDHRVLSGLFDMIVCSLRTELIAVHDYYSPTHGEVNIAVDFFKKHSGWKEIERAGTIIVLRGKCPLDEPTYRNVKVPG